MISWNNRFVIASICLLLAVFIPHSPGDEVKNGTVAATAAEAATDTAVESPPAEDSMLSLVMDSGTLGLLFMVALGLFSLVSVAVTIERTVNTQRHKIVPDEFVSELKKVVGSNTSTPADLKAVCDRHKTPAATILLAGVQRAGRPLTEVENAMEDAAAREMAALRSRVRPLTVAGSVAPLLGLLGTVVGMIIAFRTASQSGLGKGEMLAQGIYLALVTTAAGLCIAIPSILFASFFNTKIEGFFRIIDEALTETFSCFARVEERVVMVRPTEAPVATERERNVDKLMRTT